jgi:hypothetical protein
VTATLGFLLQMNYGTLFPNFESSFVFRFLILSLYYNVALGGDFLIETCWVFSKLVVLWLLCSDRSCFNKLICQFML